ncbi:MAG: DNA ligase D [Betaproteobacteria bacterium RIFCSPLOWO2_02_FULL_65_24]|nr:MAG: DNA ligase D [Betaproteobacteria bacterium RIFCSPLOWO2_02_FULL_65_24]
MPADAFSPAGRLVPYAAKRSFKDTPEPAPAERREARGPLLFVIQQHSARRMHFDFRLELDGVLKSWAVPKGLAIAPGEKHLAVPTEDHPFDYGSFEGVIPPRQYGAGPVIVWDCGLYSPDDKARLSFDDREQAEERMREALAKGKLSLFLLGAKLKGSYALVRTSKGKDWLLIKHRDRHADLVAAAAAKERSVLCGLTIEEIRSAPPPPRLNAQELVPCGPPEPLPQRLAPMLAMPGEKIPHGPEWRYEPKLDGYRVIAIVAADGVRLKSRRGLDMSAPFPEIVRELEHAAPLPMVLDGEIIALGPDGKPSFNALQNRAQLKAEAEIARAMQSSPCIYACFDLLHFDGMSLRKARYRDRTRYLAQCLMPTAHIQLIEASADGEALYRASLEAGFEGVVAKRLGSSYEAGTRSAAWVKVKAVQSDEFYIGGYAEGKGRRAERFGSLLVGKPVKGRSGKLQYAGRVGTGFDEQLLKTLHERFDTLKTAKPPFTEEPAVDRPTTWLKPKLVAEIKFAQWTPDGYLRAPVFLRLRDDTKPEPVAAGSKRTKAPGSAAQEPYTGTLLAALEGRDDRALVEVAGERLSLTHLNKVLWPADAKAGVRGYTKRELLRYLLRVSPYLLPHIVDRPLTMIRMPDGIMGERFFQKHWDQSYPPFVESITLYSESKDEAHTYFLCNNVPTLLWLGQVGTLEFHVWHSRASTWPEAAGASTDYAASLESLEASILNRPDYLVFDIDPYIYSGEEAQGAEPEYNMKAFEKGKQVAFWLKELLAELGVEAIVKTSGKTGLHVFVPIVRNLDFDAVRSISEAVSRHLERQHPGDITTQWAVKKRTGKIFMDYNMNVRAKTLNVAYSPRGVPGAPVSMPLAWDELANAQPTDYTMENALDRLQRTGDVWNDALRNKQNLEALIKFWKG